MGLQLRLWRKQFDLLVTIAILIATVATIAGRGGEDILALPRYTYEIQHGDTLWSIASRYDMHRGEAVHWIREINDITPAILPGQIIELWEVNE